MKERKNNSKGKVVIRDLGTVVSSNGDAGRALEITSDNAEVVDVVDKVMKEHGAQLLSTGEKGNNSFAFNYEGGTCEWIPKGEWGTGNLSKN